jgi:hypothetical protein
MVIELVSWIAVALILIAAGGLLVKRDWRWSMGLLAVIYLAAFWLATRHWPIGMASVKLVTGWMVTAVLGMTRLGIRRELEPTESDSPRGSWFRLFLVGIVLLIVLATAPRVETLIPGLGLQVVAGALLLMGLGLIHLGIASEVLQIVTSLLTVLAGFELLYAAVESSILVAGMLAAVNLGLALAGSYLMATQAGPEPQS